MVFSGDWETDNKIMESYLDKLQIISGSDRNRLHYINKKIGGSSLYGTTWKSWITPELNRPPSEKYKGQFKTKLLVEHPYMDAIFREFANIYFPDFFWTQVQINKNYPIPKHIDSVNVGESYLCAFGDFTGGETVVDFGGMGKYAPCKLNPRKKPVNFNGSKFEHWIEPFEGKRYSLVFFNNIKNIEKKMIK
jgi:hypothetical protein